MRSKLGPVLRVATAVFGGFTPGISTWLIEARHDEAAPAYWLTGRARPCRDADRATP